LQDEQLRDVIDKGRKMEEMYGHYFDYILVNMELDRSVEELMEEINRIEREPQWVPITWVNSY
jgi:MAGUK p55 subfamily protein 5